jgi:hypothetical protein
MIKRCLVVAVSAAVLLSACGSSGGSEVAAYCTQAKAFRAKYQDASSLTKSQIAKASAELQAIATSGPKAIRDDAQTVSDALDLYAQGATPPAFRAKEIQTASANLAKYDEKHCGVKPSPPTT